MKKLQLVKQLDCEGCTIACLSIIVGIPYFQLREILHSKISRLKGVTAVKCIGLYLDELRKILLDQFSISSKFTDLEKLKQHCISFMRSIIDVLIPTSELWCFEICLE